VSVSEITCRQARFSDIPAMAQIRAGDWGTEEYWRERIPRYLSNQLQPRQALQYRVAFVGICEENVIGLIAGHLTRRFGCHGELEWISVRPEYRGGAAGTQLLRLLASWFVERHASRICVDVEPSNQAARNFYSRCGAKDLKPHWMVWHDVSLILRKE
jgi:ribosomal protein S18 acetylase RimI-like enzyme